MEQVTAFKTKDGVIFEDIASAKMHEHIKYLENELSSFFNGYCSYQADTSHGSMARKAIIEWEMFKNGHGIKKDTVIASLIKCETVDINRMPVKILELKSRTLNCLFSAEIITIGDLLACTNKDLRKIPQLGKVGLDDIYGALKAKQLSLKPITNTNNTKPHSILPDDKNNLILVIGDVEHQITLSTNGMIFIYEFLDDDLSHICYGDTMEEAFRLLLVTAREQSWEVRFPGADTCIELPD
jgi:hypothetical protein